MLGYKGNKYSVFVRWMWTNLQVLDRKSNSESWFLKNLLDLGNSNQRIEMMAMLLILLSDSDYFLITIVCSSFRAKTKSLLKWYTRLSAYGILPFTFFSTWGKFSVDYPYSHIKFSTWGVLSSVILTNLQDEDDSGGEKAPHPVNLSSGRHSQASRLSSTCKKCFWQLNGKKEDKAAC